MRCNKKFIPFLKLVSRDEQYICAEAKSKESKVPHTRIYPGSRWLTQPMESTHPYSSPRAPPRTRDFLYYKDTPLQQAEKPLQIYILERNFPLPPHYKCKLTRLVLERNSPSPPQSRCTPGVVFELLNFCGSWTKVLGLGSFLFLTVRRRLTPRQHAQDLGLETKITSLHFSSLQNSENNIYDK